VNTCRYNSVLAMEDEDVATTNHDLKKTMWVILIAWVLFTVFVDIFFPLPLPRKRDGYLYLLNLLSLTRILTDGFYITHVMALFGRSNLITNE